MTVKTTNNAYGTLAGDINNSVTTINLSSGQGAKFPSLSAGEYFYGTLIAVNNTIEIVKVTARSSDALTVTRAQDNTSASAFSTGDRFELRPTAALFNEFVQKTGDNLVTNFSIDGDLTLTGSGFSNVTATGGAGGASGVNSYGWSGATTNADGDDSPLGGGGGDRGHVRHVANGGKKGYPGTVAGAGGGGGCGNPTSGRHAEGGDAGNQTTGSQYMAPATLTLTAGAGGGGYDIDGGGNGSRSGGDGDHGYVSVTVRAPNADGTWNNSKQSKTKNSAGSTTLVVADTAYTG